MKRPREMCENSNLNPASRKCDGSGSGAREELPLEAKHKIFLSHSGAQKNFVEQLCVDLERCDRYPFFDKRRDSLPIGEPFPNLIFKAIRQCQVGVLILSEEFFTRTKWPMLELEAIVESQKQNSKLVIMPVFLGISREQCRNHDRWESRWLEWKQEDCRIDVEKWKATLTIFGPTNGLIYKEALGEVKFREEIVEAVCARVCPETRWDDFHVQGRSRMCQVIREKVKKIDVSKTYGIRVIGIYGVGGLGKTTICKALLNNYFGEFEGRVAHVELESEVDVELMRGVLRRLTNTRLEVLAGFNKGECITHLKEKGHQHDVFLAVDNVSDTYEAYEQTRVYLTAGFTQGSVVIVTGRSKKVLTGVGVAEEDCMNMPKLDASDARSLFLHQVPNVPDVITTVDEDDITRCVKACRFWNEDKTNFYYLPLALKVFGIHLGACGYNPRLWVEELPYTSNELMNPVFEILRRSFDALGEEDKLLFMDVVLYFPKIRENFPLELQPASRITIGHDFGINIFEWLSMVHHRSVTHVKLRLQILQRKSVIEELGERIGVHDLWREFAKEETKAGGLECRSWVFVTDDENCGFDDVEPCGNRWGMLRRMCFTIKSSMENYVNMTMLTKLHYCLNVTVLHVTFHTDGVEVLDLAALKCLKSLVLVNLCSRESSKPEYKDMRVCSLRTLKSLGLFAWTDRFISSACMEDIGHLTSLQLLSLTCKHADQLPDLSNLKSLQVVQFRIEDRITEICGLNKLTKLKQLLLRFMSECTICACYGIPNLVALEELEIQGHVKVEGVFNLQKLTNLQRLSMGDHCESIKEIIGLDNLVALKDFQFGGAGGLCSLPRISKLTNLQKLDISYQSITALEGLSDAISLRYLNVSHCYEFRGLPDMAKLTYLEHLDIRRSCVQAIPGLGELVALQMLEAEHCSKLSELPDIAKLTNLHYLDISWSCVQAIPGLDDLVALRRLRAQHCSELGELPDMAKLTNLEYLDISWSCVQTIPGLGELLSLENLEAQHCSELSDIPDLQKLSKLMTLDLRWCALKTVQGLNKLEALRELFFHHCSELVALPELCMLTNLNKLNVGLCSSLKSLPSLENLSGLRELKGDWQAVSKVHKLPPGSIRLKVVGWSSQGLASLAGSADLSQLTISDCRELDELSSLSELPNLEWLILKRCNFRATPGLMNCTALRKLEINSCRELERLPDLHHLEILKIVGEENSKANAVFHMGYLPMLRELECWNLEILELPDLSSSCPQQITLTVGICGEFRRFASNGPLTWLGSLIVINCGSWRELPDLSLCTNVYSLTVINCGSLRALPDLGKCTQLSKLTIESCRSLTELPDLSLCTQLRRLTVDSCGSLRALPDSLSLCRELEWLKVRSCGSSREVPDLGLCTKLKYMDVSS